MRRLFLSILSFSLLTGCDDGDIIVTDFDFEDSSIQFCEGTNKNVFYAINNDGVFETISLEFRNSQLTLDEDGNFELPDPIDEVISFPLDNQNNRVIYRLYDGEIPTGANAYFCNVVPPSSPGVVEEWISGTGATARITGRFTDETPDGDPDNDDIPNSEEGWGSNQDTDNDSIPDYLDEDDDGDNIPTITETSSSIPLNEDGVRDSDSDGILDYLDPDDDNDGVPTRIEVSPENPDDPTDFSSVGDGTPNYRNFAQTDSFEHDIYIENEVTRRFGFQILIDNLQLSQTGSGETQRFGSTFNFGTFEGGSNTEILCPSLDADCGEPDTGEEEEEETEETN